MRRIISTSYHGITRELDMMCLGFSQNHTFAYSLHVQTQWRFIHNHQIILASRDMYIPYSNAVGEDWDYSIQGRSKEESSIFDAKCQEIDRLMDGSIVSDCTISEFGDLQISFSNNVLFQIFIPASVKDEEWRLVDLIRDEHVVFHDV